MQQPAHPAIPSSPDRRYCWIFCGNAKKVAQSLLPLTNHILQTPLHSTEGELPPISLYRLETATKSDAKNLSAEPTEDDGHGATAAKEVCLLRWLTAEGVVTEPPLLSDVDLLLLKLGDASLHVRSAVLQWIEAVQDARRCLARPPLIVVDPVDAVDRVSSRSDLLHRLHRSTALRRLGFGVPATVAYDMQKQAVLSVIGYDRASLEAARVDDGSLVIVKPDLSNGPASTHAMVVLPRSAVLRQLCRVPAEDKRPSQRADTAECDAPVDVAVNGQVLVRHSAQLGGHTRVVVQELLLDAEVVHKVYIIGDSEPQVVKLRNDTLLRQARRHNAAQWESDAAAGFAFHSQEKSLFPTLPPSDVEREEGDDERASPSSLDAQLLTSLATVLRAELGLTLLGVDVVASRLRSSQTCSEGEADGGPLWNVIDVNYFPSFSSVPDAHRRLAHHLLHLCCRGDTEELERRSDGR